MSLNSNTELALINTTTNSGTITLPSAITVPGRVISFKDSAGNFLTKNFTLICDGSDTFEDGTTQKVFNESFGSIQVVASGTKWFILSGVKQNMMTISSLITSTISTRNIFTNTFTTNSISTVNISSASNYTSALFSGSYNGIIAGGNINMNGDLFPTTGGGVNRDLGSITNRWNNLFVSTMSSIHTTTSTLQVQNTITASTINVNTASGTTLSFFNVSTNNITGFNLLGTTTLSTQQIFCSSLQIGPTDAILDILGPLRTQDMSTITCQASTIVANTLTLNRIFGGSLVANGTTTQNLNPFTIGAQIGFGSNTAGLGFYNEGHFTSTFTRVIQPTLDTGSYSNIVTVNGNISTPNIFSSTINSGTVTLTTGGFTQRVVSSAVAPSGTVTLNLTSGNVFYFTTAIPTATTVNFTTASATVGSTYYVNFLSGTPTASNITFTGNTGATTLSITGLSLVGNPSVSIGLHGAAQSFTPAVNTRYMFTCIAIAP